MDSPRLSICIPTYRQPEKLRRTLRSLEGQIGSEVEVLARDDSPEDDSERIVREYTGHFPIRYVRGKKEGLDAAILSLTEAARGHYVWWIGDDAVAPGAVDRLLAVLARFPDASFLYLRSGTIGEERPIPEGGDVAVFRDRDEVLTEVVDMLGYISATVFRRSAALPGMEGAKRYLGSAWVNLYLILHVLAGEGALLRLESAYVFGDPKLPEEPLWYDRFEVFGVNFWKVLREFDGRFSPSAIRTALRKNFEKLVRGVLVARAKGYTRNLGSADVRLRRLLPFYWSFPAFWIAAPFFLLPRPFAQFLYKGYKKVR